MTQTGEHKAVFLTEGEYFDLLEMNRRLLKENVDLKIEVAELKKRVENDSDKYSD